MPQAGRLETLVPGAGHLVHMPAHIYIRTGQYAKSAKSNADAAAVDEKYFKATGAGGTFYPMMYYRHNLQFESAAAMFAGNLAQARAAAQRTVALADPIADQMVMIEPFAAQELAVLVRFGQWGPILEAKAPAPTRALQTSLYHFARGAALAATGKAAEAEAELAALKAACGQDSEGCDGRRRRIRRRTCSPLPIADLTARIAEAKGDTAGAIKGFTAAVAAEDQARLQRAARLVESRARAARRAVCCKAGRYAEAEKVFRADLVEEHRQPAIALWAVPQPRRAEEGRGRRSEGVVRQGLGWRRRDAERRSVRARR